jgi:nitrate/TMAO reductase-like tetraheme cytochrome c subunit
MAEGFKAGLTCIDCHKGIAHKLPTMPDEEEEPKKQ